jgi:hypothetical protein
MTSSTAVGVASTSPTSPTASSSNNAPNSSVAILCLDLPLGVGLSTITAIANALDVKAEPVTKGLKASVYKLLSPKTLLVLDLMKLKASGFNITSLPLPTCVQE